MKKTITNSEFHQAFESIRPDNFSYAGLNALWDYLEQYEDSTGEETELDVIAICCEFREYKSLKEFQDDFGDEYKTMEDIEKKTTVIKIDDKIIIQVF